MFVENGVHEDHSSLFPSCFTAKGATKLRPQGSHPPVTFMASSQMDNPIAQSKLLLKH